MRGLCFLSSEGLILKRLVLLGSREEKAGWGSEKKVRTEKFSTPKRRDFRHLASRWKNIPFPKESLSTCYVITLCPKRLTNRDFYCFCHLVTKSCPTLWWPQGQQSPSMLCPWDFPGKNIGVGCHFLLLTQGWNHWATWDTQGVCWFLLKESPTRDQRLEESDTEIVTSLFLSQEATLGWCVPR